MRHGARRKRLGIKAARTGLEVFESPHGVQGIQVGRTGARPLAGKMGAIPWEIRAMAARIWSKNGSTEKETGETEILVFCPCLGEISKQIYS